MYHEVDSNKSLNLIKKMKKNLSVIVVAAFAAIGLSSQAQIIPPTIVTYTGVSNGQPVENQLSIKYEVTESANLYTYSYTFVTTPGVALSSFALGGPTDPVDTQGIVISNPGLTDPGLDGVTANSIIFGWDIPADVTKDTIAFTSPNAPGYATFSMNDDDIVWTSPPSIPAPEPVPEPTTVLAGAMMLLPFGVGAVRAIRKSRAI